MTTPSRKPTLMVERKRPDPNFVAGVYARICRDGRVASDIDGMTRAAMLAGKVLGLHGIEIWAALGMYNMERIAKDPQTTLDSEPIKAAMLKEVSEP